MPSIAVLIGVSTYKSEAHLPACSHDVENLRQLLAATKKYDEIVSLTERTDASQLKDDLRAFFMRHQTGGPIEEAFVYFSGHGTYQNDAMFCCSDFDASRPATTSISNAELDDLLRSVEPEIAVKVIDACQSGSPYIKDAGASFEKALSSSKLRSFLCMTSSRQDQSSYATAAESDFTSCWISAALSKSDGSVFYRDIQAYLADSFSSHPDQTPYFVNQGTSLEVFSAVTDEMRSLRSARQKIPSVAKANTDVITAIERVIAKEDARFVALADASKAIEKCKASLLAYQVSDHIVQAFYSCAVSLEPKLDALPRAAAIAQFAVEQAWQKKFFVSIQRRATQSRELKPDVRSLVVRAPTSLVERFLSTKDESNYVERTVMQPIAIVSTEQLPFEVAEISYTSTHASLPAFRSYVALVHSRTDVMVVSATTRLTLKGWSEQSPVLAEVQWRYAAIPWATVVKNPNVIWEESIARVEADVRLYLEGLIPREETAGVAEPKPSDPPPGD